MRHGGNGIPPRGPGLPLRLGLLLLACQLASQVAAAQCTSFSSAPGSVRLGDTIELLFGDDVPEAVVERAIGIWQGCGDYGVDFPAFVTEQPGTRSLRIRYHEAPGSEKCGSFRENRIDLYQTTEDTLGRRRMCGPLEINLAHELGHALGLADAGLDGSCRRHIMSRIVRTNLHARQVRQDECQAAGERWLTLAEQERVGRFGRLSR